MVTLDPLRDIDTINLELIFSDLDVLERRMEKSVKLVRSGDKTAKMEYELMERIKNHLESNLPVRTLSFTDEESIFTNSLFLITSKPVLYAANISEEDLVSGNALNEMVKKVTDFAANENSEVIIVCARLEEELIHSR